MLDYIIWLDRGSKAREAKEGWHSDKSQSTDSVKSSKIKVKLDTTKVEPQFINKDDNGFYDYPFTQLSDHYGVSTELYIDGEEV